MRQGEIQEVDSLWQHTSSVWPCLSLSVWAQKNLWRCNSTPGGKKKQRKKENASDRSCKGVQIIKILPDPIISNLAQHWKWHLPESVRAQAPIYGEIQVGTLQWMLAGSTLLSTSLGQLLPTSGRALEYRGPCLGAFAVGPAARKVVPGDRDLLG